MFDFATWTRPEDEDDALVGGFGELAVFIAAEGRWSAAVDAWGLAHGLDRREVRELVTRRPSWPRDYVGRS